MPNILAVVLDYGHTIINFTPAQDAIVDSYREVRRLLSAEVERDVPHAAELVRALSQRVDTLVTQSYERGDPAELDIIRLYSDALQALGFTVSPEFVHRLNVIEHRAMASELAVSEQNLQALRDLRIAGYKLGIVSNAAFLPEMMWEDIRRLGIADCVDEAVFSAEVGVRKPDPIIFLNVLDRLGVQPTEAVFVGDRLRDDIAGAKRLGMTTVLTHEFRQEAVTADTAQPDITIRVLPELLPLLAALKGD